MNERETAVIGNAVARSIASGTASASCVLADSTNFAASERKSVHFRTPRIFGPRDCNEFLARRLREPNRRQKHNGERPECDDCQQPDKKLAKPVLPVTHVDVPELDDCLGIQNVAWQCQTAEVGWCRHQLGTIPPEQCFGAGRHTLVQRASAEPIEPMPVLQPAAISAAVASARFVECEVA